MPNFGEMSNFQIEFFSNKKFSIKIDKNKFTFVRYSIIGNQMTARKMNIIVAVDASGGIAKNNNMAWHLPNEYAHFVKQTTQTVNPNRVNAVIMGRKWCVANKQTN